MSQRREHLARDRARLKCAKLLATFIKELDTYEQRKPALWNVRAYVKWLKDRPTLPEELSNAISK